ncbi:17098_t:CDS:2 [Dentiscutata erythropus]|uniref:17098_t:CDS:1 n=1 Tax=Dentiscutata erythropus TaxID=1348616 RepID=A0A9N9H9R1_9GLOM|nr:17098_t:CDS:2 [Dentiscutata erythropus]
MKLSKTLKQKDFESLMMPWQCNVAFKKLVLTSYERDLMPEAYRLDPVKDDFFDKELRSGPTYNPYNIGKQNKMAEALLEKYSEIHQIENW